MADNKGKFDLMALDKAQVVEMVNVVGAGVAQDNGKSTPERLFEKTGALLTGLFAPGAGHSSVIKDEISKLGLDTHEGRKDFLSKKLGVDSNTSENYRLVAYSNESGQVMFFKGHMEGEKKLVLTESIAASDAPDRIHQLFQSSFKPMPKPIEVQVEKATVTADGFTRFDVSADERKKLETQSSLVAAINKSGDVQLTSNARLPGSQRGTGAGLTA